MRLINADNFAEILSEIRAQYDCFDRDEIAGYEAISEALEKLKEVPTVQPPMGYRALDGGWEYFGFPESVERVVYCGNCIYGEPNENNANEIICTNDWGSRSKWGYCSDGERRVD